MAEVGNISVNIEARLADLEAGLHRAEARVRESTGRMSEVTNKMNFFDNVGHKVAHLFVGIHALRAGAELVAGGLHLWKGHIEEAAEAFEKIPILGHIFSAGRDIRAALDESFGIFGHEKQQLEQMQQDTEKENKKNELEVKRGEIIKHIVHTTDESGFTSEQASRLVGLEGLQASLRENANAFLNNERSFNRQVAEANKSGLSEQQRLKAVDAINAARDKEFELLQRNRMEIELQIKRQKEAIAAEFDAMQIEADARMRQRNFFLEDAREERERLSRIRSFDIESENKIRRLNLLGNPLEAQKAEINEDIDKRKTKAFSEEERKQLEEERALRIRGLRTAGLPFLEQFLADQHTGIGAARQVVAARTAFGAIAHQDPLVRQAEKQGNLLQQIERNTRREQARSVLGADR